MANSRARLDAATTPATARGCKAELRFFCVAELSRIAVISAMLRIDGCLGSGRGKHPLNKIMLTFEFLIIEGQLSQKSTDLPNL
jgi:hypothetical protein